MMHCMRDPRPDARDFHSPHVSLPVPVAANAQHGDPKPHQRHQRGGSWMSLGMAGGFAAASVALAGTAHAASDDKRKAAAPLASVVPVELPSR